MTKKVYKSLDELGISWSDIDKAISLSENWLLNSGIQNMHNRPKLYGSFNSWYDKDLKIYPYIYSEVTGYGITLFLYLNNLSKDDKCLNSAVAAANWLLKYAYEEPSNIVKFRFYYHIDDFSPRHAYTFDTGIIINGLVNLYRQTKDKSLLNKSIDMANWVTDVMQRKDGEFLSFYDIDDNIRLLSPDIWSKRPGAYHAKMCFCLLRLYDVVRNEKYLNAAKQICNWTLNQQLEDGRFLCISEENITNAHPHCYGIEGLLYAGIYLNEEEYVKNAVKGIVWLLDKQLPNGGVPSEFVGDSPVLKERCDALAQMIRLSLITLDMKRLSEKYIPSIAKMIKRLLEFQCQESDPSAKGGFYYIIDSNGNKVNHINSWATMFALQALCMFKQMTNKKGKFDINYFV
ncbi:MAG: glycoside hydrolase family 88 protein [Planctomycetota bacterium]